MYDYLSGALAHVDPKTAVIDCGGVGYKCSITETTYKAILSADHVKLFTVLSVREDAMELYGFASDGERSCFETLTTVSGVGPKAALAVLSALTEAELCVAVSQGDYKALTRANGVGPKLAQRICLELKDKLTYGGGEEEASFAQTNLQTASEKEDATEILISLGYTRADARHALDRCSADNARDLVKQALRLLNTLR